MERARYREIVTKQDTSEYILRPSRPSLHINIESLPISAEIEKYNMNQPKINQVIFDRSMPEDRKDPLCCHLNASPEKQYSPICSNPYSSPPKPCEPVRYQQTNFRHFQARPCNIPPPCASPKLFIQCPPGGALTCGKREEPINLQCYILRLLQFLLCSLCVIVGIILIFLGQEVLIVAIKPFFIGISFTFGFICLFDLLGYTMHKTIPCDYTWVLFTTLAYLLFMTAAGLSLTLVHFRWTEILMFVMSFITGIVFLTDLIRVLCHNPPIDTDSTCYKDTLKTLGQIVQTPPSCKLEKFCGPCGIHGCKNTGPHEHYVCHYPNASPQNLENKPTYEKPPPNKIVHDTYCPTDDDDYDDFDDDDDDDECICDVETQEKPKAICYKPIVEKTQSLNTCYERGQSKQKMIEYIEERYEETPQRPCYKPPPCHENGEKPCYKPIIPCYQKERLSQFRETQQLSTNEDNLECYKPTLPCYENPENPCHKPKIQSKKSSIIKCYEDGEKPCYEIKNIEEPSTSEICYDNPDQPCYKPIKKEIKTCERERKSRYVIKNKEQASISEKYYEHSDLSFNKATLPCYQNPDKPCYIPPVPCYETPEKPCYKPIIPCYAKERSSLSTNEENKIFKTPCYKPTLPCYENPENPCYKPKIRSKKSSIIKCYEDGEKPCHEVKTIEEPSTSEICYDNPDQPCYKPIKKEIKTCVHERTTHNVIKNKEKSSINDTYYGHSDQSFYRATLPCYENPEKPCYKPPIPCDENPENPCYKPKIRSKKSPIIKCYGDGEKPCYEIKSIEEPSTSGICYENPDQPCYKPIQKEIKTCEHERKTRNVIKNKEKSSISDTYYEHSDQSFYKATLPCYEAPENPCYKPPIPCDENPENPCYKPPIPCYENQENLSKATLPCYESSGKPAYKTTPPCYESSGKHSKVITPCYENLERPCYLGKFEEEPFPTEQCHESPEKPCDKPKVQPKKPSITKCLEDPIPCHKINQDVPSASQKHPGKSSWSKPIQTEIKAYENREKSIYIKKNKDKESAIEICHATSGTPCDKHVQAVSCEEREKSFYLMKNKELLESTTEKCHGSPEKPCYKQKQSTPTKVNTEMSEYLEHVPVIIERTSCHFEEERRESTSCVSMQDDENCSPNCYENTITTQVSDIIQHQICTNTTCHSKGICTCNITSPKKKKKLAVREDRMSRRSVESCRKVTESCSASPTKSESKSKCACAATRSVSISPEALTYRKDEATCSAQLPGSAERNINSFSTY